MTVVDYSRDLPKMPDVGTVVRDYEFCNLINVGGQAAVYRVRSRQYNEMFAAKVLLDARINEQNSAELGAMRRLDHPHVIRLYDHFTSGGALILIYELCLGGTLMDELMEWPGGLTRERFVFLGRELVSAVAAAHAAEISHRDICPQNMMFRDSQRRNLRLSDFGFARLGRRRSCQRYGSAAFMAPELLDSEEPADCFCADVWALGFTFMLMLHGRQLWAVAPEIARERVLSGELRCGDEVIDSLVERMLAPVCSRMSIGDIAASPLFAAGPRQFCRVERVPLACDDRQAFPGATGGRCAGQLLRPSRSWGFRPVLHGISSAGRRRSFAARPS